MPIKCRPALAMAKFIVVAASLAVGLASACVKKRLPAEVESASSHSGALAPLMADCLAGSKLNPRYWDVVKLTRKYTNVDDLPGLPGGPDEVKEAATGRYLLTSTPGLLEIMKQEYSWGFHVREMDGAQLLIDPQTIEIPSINKMELTNILLVSKRHSGSAGYVRLGCLNDGKIVAAKTYPQRDIDDPERAQAHFEREVKSAILADKLGIGVKFFGLYRHSDGLNYSVTQLVPGDMLLEVKSELGGVALRNQESQFSKIVTRLKMVGVDWYRWDSQALSTMEGDTLVIDPPPIFRCLSDLRKGKSCAP